MTKPLETGAHAGSPAEKTNAARRSRTAHVGWSVIRRRAKDLVAGMPEGVVGGMKKNPYTGVAVAGAVGLGVGILLGSRVLRAVVASTVSYAVVEATRAFLREWVTTGGDGGPAATPRS
jgi:hypothetical protein